MKLILILACKQAKLSHLRHRKPVRIHWKADTPKTSRCLVQILVQRQNWATFSSKMSKERPLQSIAIIIGPCWTRWLNWSLNHDFSCSMSTQYFKGISKFISWFCYFKKSFLNFETIIFNACFYKNKKEIRP